MMKRYHLYLTAVVLCTTVNSLKAQWTTGTDIYNQNSGNVGINTSAPSAKFSVNGTSLFGGPASNLDPVYTPNDISHLAYSRQLLVGWNRSAGGGETDFISNRGPGGNGGFSFYDYANDNTLTHLLSIKGNGNVGIGTEDTQGYKLAVKGSIIAELVHVKLEADWPDYVFHPNYELQKLSEVKAYIDQHHHLPELPSAAQVKKEGINLGEMNGRLLKKIEELTLHLIEKDKQLQEEKDRNDAQQKELLAQHRELSVQKLVIGQVMQKIQDLEKR